VIALLVLTSCSSAVAVPQQDFTQETKVDGKVPVSLGGAWFLYAQARVQSGRAIALSPQLFTVAQKGNRDVALHLLDVEFPKSIDEPYRASLRKPKAWEPSPADIALLRKDWSKLPPDTTKDVHANDVAYDRVEFTLASPEKYAEAFPDVGDAVQEALKGSVFALRVIEKYRPLPVAPEEKIAQVMERKSMYVVRRASDSVLEGEQFTGYVAAGPGVPIPISLAGPFKLYRLAKGTVGPPPPAHGRSPTKRKGK
jgi:hypothetical protein